MCSKLSVENTAPDKNWSSSEHFMYVHEELCVLLARLFKFISNHNYVLGALVDSVIIILNYSKHASKKIIDKLPLKIITKLICWTHYNKWQPAWLDARHNICLYDQYMFIWSIYVYFEADFELLQVTSSSYVFVIHRFK